MLSFAVLAALITLSRVEGREASSLKQGMTTESFITIDQMLGLKSESMDQSYFSHSTKEAAAASLAATIGAMPIWMGQSMASVGSSQRRERSVAGA